LALLQYANECATGWSDQNTCCKGELRRKNNAEDFIRNFFIIKLSRCTIGPQTKRLSGAQRERLIRERKLREGTWTEKKPPRKTPSQDKGTVVSSGGVKRPHSDSSTPSLEKQQPKKKKPP
jgi:hypothetical protein